MKSPISFFLVLPLAVALTAGTAAQDIEHYFRFTIRTKTELDRVTRVISISNVVHDTVYAYANEEQWKTFRGLGYEVVELPHPSGQYEHEMLNSPPQRPDRSVDFRRQHENTRRHCLCASRHHRCNSQHHRAGH